MKRPTIGFAIHSLSGGGAERVISILVTYFADRGYSVHLINNIRTANEYWIDDKVNRHIIGERVSTIRGIASFQRLYHLRQVCRKERIDILVAFMGMNEYSVLATYGIHTRNIISTRIAPEIQFNTVVKRIIGRILLSTASGAVFQTRDAQRWFPNILQQKSTIILNPIGKQFYGIGRQIENGLLVASGRLTAQKNYPMMLKAISIVSKLKKIRLEIYGEGEDEEKLKSLSEELLVSNIVSFCGRCDDMPLALSHADIYLLASNYEGLPNALMEAMAVGVPCIATDSLGGGSKLLIGNDERGVICSTGDVNQFADAIIRLLSDEELKTRLSTNGKEFAERFTIDNCCKLWEEYIMEIFNKKKI